MLGFGSDDFKAFGESAVELDFLFHGQLSGRVHGIKFACQEEHVEFLERAELGCHFTQHLGYSWFTCSRFASKIEMASFLFFLYRFISS